MHPKTMFCAVMEQHLVSTSEQVWEQYYILIDLRYIPWKTEIIRTGGKENLM